jgi:branched-chain amino acid transport system ATP-binding protein
MTRFDVKDLTCHHGQLTALRGVSLSLNAGEVLCIIGANGAGKTTLMRAMAGAHVPTSGSITLNGTDVTRQSSFARFRGGISMSPEGRRLFPDMTVRENLMIAAENGRDGEWDIERVLEAFPQLQPLINKLAGGLSGGQRQSAAIGRALLANPEVLLLDEVSLGLSPAAIEGVYQSLTKIKEDRKMMMVVVEQDLNRALGFADQVLCIAEGATELYGRPEDFSKDQITAAYFGIHDQETADA